MFGGGGAHCKACRAHGSPCATGAYVDSEDFEGRVTRRRCPEIENRPLHPAEFEAWRIAASAGAWRPRLHPRWKDAARPALDWPACRAAHDPEAAPWPEVRVMLAAIEVGARKAPYSTESEAGE